MDAGKNLSEHVTTTLETAASERNAAKDLNGSEETKNSHRIGAGSKTEIKPDDMPHKEAPSSTEKSIAAQELGFESVSDTKSDEESTEEVEEEYYESISEDDQQTEAEVDDISSAEDESFADTVATYSFTDLPFVPKAEFSSELRNTVVEKKFDSEENNFNRKPFSSSVQSASDRNVSGFIHNADFSVPPPNFQYPAVESRPVGYSGYNSNQPGYPEYPAQQSYDQQQQWYHMGQANYNQAQFANQQYYNHGVPDYNYSQVYSESQTAYNQSYGDYSQAGYVAQQGYSDPSVGVQSQADYSQPQVPLQAAHTQVDTSEQSVSYDAKQRSSRWSQVESGISGASANNSDKSVLNSASAVTGVKKVTSSKPVKISKDQTRVGKVGSEETVCVSNNSSGCDAVKDATPAADWLDENGDPIKGAFDFVAPDDSNSSPADTKSSKIEYVFSVRNSSSVKDPSTSTLTESGASETSGTVAKKHSVTGTAGLSISEQIAAERAKVAKKEISEDEEKKLYEASKNREEYKEALQAALATTSLAKVTPSTSKLLAKNAAANKERVSRFKRNQFTNQKLEVQPDPVSVAVEPQKTQAEVALESQAITEILKEVQHGAARAKQFGALGWQKSRMPVVNKTFLHNTLVSTLRKPYRPPSKRGGRSTQGLHDKEDDSHSSSSSRSSRSYSSRSGSSSSRSSRSSYSGSSDRSRSRERHPPPEYFDEAWAAYAAHYGYPWMGPEAYAMYYGPEGWPMEAYDAMYFGDPQAWAEYEAFYGPQNFNPRARGRGFRGRGRDRGRGMDFRGRGGRGMEFRGRGWDMDFRGRGRGMDFRGGPPRGFPEQFRGAGPRGFRRREFSRSRSRSAESRSDNEARGGSKYGSMSRNNSRAGSRHSRSRSRSQSPLDKQRRRDRSVSASKESRQGRSDNETKDKSKKKKKKKKKHRKSKKKDKNDEKDGSTEGQAKEENKGEDAISESTEKSKDKQADGEKEEDKSKSKKSKKHSKRKGKGEKRRKNKSKEEKPVEGKGEGSDAKADTVETKEDDGRDGGKGRTKEEERSKELGKTGEASENISSESGSKEQKAAARGKGGKTRRRSKDREKRNRSETTTDQRVDNASKESELSEGKGGNSRTSNQYPESKSSEKYEKEYRRRQDDDYYYNNKRKSEQSRQREDSYERRMRDRGEALENDLRLKLKAKRQQSLMQANQQASEQSSAEAVASEDKSRPIQKSNSEPSLSLPEGSGKKKVVKKKIVKKKKEETQLGEAGGTIESTSEEKPKKKRIVKRTIIVKRKKDESGKVIDVSRTVYEGGVMITGQGSEENPGIHGSDPGKEGEGAESKGVKRKRIVKRKIIVKRKKVKPGDQDSKEAGSLDKETVVTMGDGGLCDSRDKSESLTQTDEQPPATGS